MFGGPGSMRGGFPMLDRSVLPCHDLSTGVRAWSAFESLLEFREEHVRRVEPTYFWRAIVHDPDDNTFVDAAVAGDAEWIVTEDTHFQALEIETRLTVRPIQPTRFIARYLESGGPPELDTLAPDRDDR